MQNNQVRAHTCQLPPLLGLHARRQYSSALIIPGPGIRQLETVPAPQSPQKLFQLASHKPVYPALPGFPMETMLRVHACAFPGSFCLQLTLGLPQVALCGACGVALPLGNLMNCPLFCLIKHLGLNSCLRLTHYL